MKDKKLFITSVIFLFLFIIFVAVIFSSLRNIFMPFIIMLAFVYLLSPAVSFLKRRKIKPLFAVILVYVVLLLIILFGLFIAVPIINSAIKEVWQILKEYADNFIEIDKSIFSKGAQSAYTTAVGAVKTVTSVLVGAVAAFYFLAGGKGIKHGISEVVPIKLKPYFKILSDDVKLSLDSFFKGQILIAIILFIIDAIFLYVMKIPYAAGLGAIAAILDIVPYAGAFIGVSLILTVTFLNAPNKFLIILIGLLIIQQIENNVISPKVSSDTMKLHPSVTILVLYVGAFGGFWGILLAIPLTSIFCRIVRRLIQSLV